MPDLFAVPRLHADLRLVQLEQTQVFGCRCVGRPADKSCKCPDVSHIAAARVLIETAHDHVFDHACPTGRWEGPEVIGGSFLEPKVAGPSMLGIGRPDRHALPTLAARTALVARLRPEQNCDI